MSRPYWRGSEGFVAARHRRRSLNMQMGTGVMFGTAAQKGKMHNALLASKIANRAILALDDVSRRKRTCINT